jgi:hypothetical protein
MPSMLEREDQKRASKQRRKKGLGIKKEGLFTSFFDGGLVV